MGQLGRHQLLCAPSRSFLHLHIRSQPNPRWLPLLIRHGLEIYCGLDSDSTGDNMAKDMMTLYPGVRRLRPIQHDWNDDLKAHSIMPQPSP